MNSIRDVWEMQCPRCNSAEKLSIAIKVWAVLSRNGTDAYADPHGHHEWDSESACKCWACGWIGTTDEAENAYERAENEPGTVTEGDTA